MIKINCSAFNYYGLFIIIGLIFGLFIINKFLLNWKINKIHLFLYNIFLFINIILFGLLLTIFENYIFYNKIIIGFSSYGGVIGALLFTIIFCKVFKYNYYHFYSILFISFPLIYSFSKIGCFLSGCCFGIKYTGLLSVMYVSSNEAPLNVNLFPIQLLESVVFFVIFIYLYLKYKNDSKLIIYKSMICCGISKFLLEYLRNSWVPLISFTQIISLLFIVIGIMLLKRRKKYEKISSRNKNRK